MPNHKLTIPVVAGLLILFTAAPALPTPIDLISGVGGAVVALGPGTGRGIGFRADSSFTISSLAIEASLASQPFQAVVWSSTDGNQANSILTSATATVGGAFGYHSIPISYSFAGGNYYALQWRPLASNSGWVTSPGLQYYSDSGLPVTVGPVTLINGFEGWSATHFANSVHPSLRIEVGSAAVPEPATAGLVLFGLAAGIAILRRRRRA